MLTESKKKVQELIRLILHNDIHKGISEYRYKNSRLKPVSYQGDNGRGTIFGFHTKELMQHSVGVIMHSIEALDDNLDSFTHWTPNSYRYGQYVNDKHTVVSGHREENLRQINCFVVDIDNKNAKSNEILEKTYELGMMPTALLATPHGYQLYFVLSEPAFVTKKTNYKVVKVAKNISMNLRRWFATSFAVDQGCNHFGIFRIPRTDNVLWYQPQYRYSFNTWLNWSMKYSDDYKTAKPNLTVLTNTQGKYNQIQEPWFNLLMNLAGNIKGSKGRLGRNNIIFTLALGYYASAKSKQTAEFNLLQLNNNFSEPLKDSELARTVKDAYLGRYKGASHEHVQIIVDEYVPKEEQPKQLFTVHRWFHFAKERDQRERSHYSERVEDLLAYLSAHTSGEKPYLRMKRSELLKAVKMPSSTYAVVIKQLQKDGLVIAGRTAYRNGFITLGLKRKLMVALMISRAKKLAKHEEDLASLAKILGLTISELEQLAAETQNEALEISEKASLQGLKVVMDP